MADTIGAAPKMTFCVIEKHDSYGPCMQCDCRGWHTCFWFNVDWVSGANPPGKPLLILCDNCLEMAKSGVGPVVL